MLTDVKMKQLLDNLNLIDMDNISEVRKFVRKYLKYLRAENNLSDIEVLKSTKFRQIFIAHNMEKPFKIYDSWSFLIDVKDNIAKEYINIHEEDKEAYVDKLITYLN